MAAFGNNRLFQSGREPRGARVRNAPILVPVLLIASIALLAVGRFEPATLAPVRAAIAGWVAPAIAAGSAVFAPLSRAVSQLMAAPRSPLETRDLEAEVARLTALAARVGDLERENRDLRKLTRFAGSGARSMTTAAVVASSAGPLSQTILIDAGRNKGIKPGFPVIAGEGLLGRVIQAHADHATVMLLGDRLSRVPVQIGERQIRAVLAGGGAAPPRLDFLPAGGAIAAGDLVTTSGVGGVFPRGLAVGRIADDGFGKLHVILSAGHDSVAAAGVMMLEAGAFDPTDQGAVRPERTIKSATAQPASGVAP
jgi:rod shape-determining protein MreC